VKLCCPFKVGPPIEVSTISFLPKIPARGVSTRAAAPAMKCNNASTPISYFIIGLELCAVFPQGLKRCPFKTGL